MKNLRKSVCRQIIFAFCLIFISTTINAQKVKIKKGKININEKEVFNYKDEENSVSVYNIRSNEEIIFIKINKGKITEGPDKYKDDYITYMFLNEKIKVEISSPKYDFGLLYNQGVFDLDGNLNFEKMKIFKEKYDENISEKTIFVK